MSVAICAKHNLMRLQRWTDGAAVSYCPACEIENPDMSKKSKPPVRPVEDAELISDLVPTAEQEAEIRRAVDILYRAEPLDLVTEELCWAIATYDKAVRENDSNALKAYRRGLAAGRRQAGSTQIAVLLEKLEAVGMELGIERALNEFEAWCAAVREKANA